MQAWDIVVLVALFITCGFTPFEVALLPTRVDAALIFSQFINCIFIIDLVITFFLPIEGPDGRTLTTHKAIAIKYIKGMFLVDFVSCIPFELFTLASSADAIDPSSVKPIKMLRLLRVFKVMRIVKASRIFARWENHITLSFTAKSLITWTVVLLFYIHWSSCGWAFLAVIMGSQRTPELQAYMLVEMASNTNAVKPCTACVNVSPALCSSECLTSCELNVLARIRATSVANVMNDENWICRATNSGVLAPSAVSVNAYQTSDAFAIWMIPLSANGMMTPTNITERLVSFVLQFASLFIWSVFTGVVCGAIANVDPFVMDYRVTVDNLNKFLDANDAPKELRLRAREYLRNSKSIAAKNAFTSFIEKLSKKLKNETASVCASKVLMSVPFVSKLETECVAELSQRLVYRGVENRGSLSKEEVKGTLFIVVDGVAACGGKILTAGMYFGEDMIMTSERLMVLQKVAAMSYLEMATLSRSALNEVVQQYPKSAATLRTSAMLRAVQRVAIMIETYNERKQRKMRLRGVQPGPDQVAVTEKDMENIFKTATGKKHIRNIEASPDPRQKHVMVEPPPSERGDDSEQGRALRDVSNRLSATETALRDLAQSQAKILDALKLRDSTPMRLPFFSSALDA